ncbi:DUF4396 domain-containing protein [Roseibium sp. RKSG952]|uniref:DUF4396 domain-containing protein n=1 Tax=Roseibium sp. RKSG952 TaxID=2529384 RepID=UPI0012BB6DAD|nr:DUF4396 domain-containing protein [Roseibium sp. RKSG952]MTH98108.1 DUF4396 domain-containing protein [Roseibium sp. RKSG952]
MLQGAMIVWFLLTAASLIFVIWDSIFNGVTSWVQKLAWILVVAYTGPVGCFVYLLACRRPFPGGHDAFTNVPWKQGINSEMHCLAGDATGILIAASIVPLLGLTNGWDSIFEYIAGFVCGLFIFQALMMRGMYNGDYWLAVRKTIFAETVSMNCVMFGMLPTMIVFAAIWPGSTDPLAAEFWFRMSLASVVGLITAFPVNYWLVAANLKHGCMTLPGADTISIGHRSPEHSIVSETGMTHDHGGHGSGMSHHPQGKMDHSSHGGHKMSDHTMSDKDAPESGHGLNAMHGHMDHDHGSHQHGGSHEGHGGMAMKSLPMAIQILLILASFVLLIGAGLITNLFVPIRF